MQLATEASSEGRRSLPRRPGPVARHQIHRGARVRGRCADWNCLTGGLRVRQLPLTGLGPCRNGDRAATCRTAFPPTWEQPRTAALSPRWLLAVLNGTCMQVVIGIGSVGG